MNMSYKIDCLRQAELVAMTTFEMLKVKELIYLLEF